MKKDHVFHRGFTLCVCVLLILQLAVLPACRATEDDEYGYEDGRAGECEFPFWTVVGDPGADIYFDADTDIVDSLVDAIDDVGIEGVFGYSQGNSDAFFLAAVLQMVISGADTGEDLMIHLYAPTVNAAMRS